VVPPELRSTAPTHHEVVGVGDRASQNPADGIPFAHAAAVRKHQRVVRRARKPHMVRIPRVVRRPQRICLLCSRPAHPLSAVGHAPRLLCGRSHTTYRDERPLPRHTGNATEGHAVQPRHAEQRIHYGRAAVCMRLCSRVSHHGQGRRCHLGGVGIVRRRGRQDCFGRRGLPCRCRRLLRLYLCLWLQRWLLVRQRGGRGQQRRRRRRRHTASGKRLGQGKLAHHRGHIHKMAGNRLQGVRVALVALVALWAIGARAGGDGWVVVVGDVSATEAMLLLQRPQEASGAGDVTVSAWDYGTWPGPPALTTPSSPAATVTAHVRADAPTRVRLRGLVPRHQYRVLVLAADDAPIEAEVVTLPRPGDPTPFTLVALSCNRWNEDGDTEAWAALQREAPDRLGTVHLGDQIYADALLAWFRTTRPAPTAAAVADAFGELYRATWAAPPVAAVLRRRAHWMLPDDHDVLNNWDARHYADATLRPFIDGALQAYARYQQALRLDVDDEVTGPVPAHHARRIGQMGLLLADVRLARATGADATHPLWGTAQWQFLQVRQGEPQK
jgi:hypothetical protein